MKKVIGLAGILSTCAFAGCAVENSAEDLSQKAQYAKSNIDVRRSLAVTEQAILARFSFQRVMEQLASQSGVDGLTATQLFQQWWDTQNPGPGTYAGAHCDDLNDPARGPLLNDFPYICRGAPSEGAQVSCDPFASDSSCEYIPIGLFNRFDMAPHDGAHCGEHRVVFAKKTGVDDSADRNLVIFEAVVPNPLPVLGLKGCQEIVKTWAKLSKENNIEKRADILEEFYFDGSALSAPVIHIDHLGTGPSGLGQVRTNQFIFANSSHENTGWMLREFKLSSTCDENGCSALEFLPVTNKTNAAGELFNPASNHPLVSAFQAHFPTQIAALSSEDVGRIGMNIPDEFNSGQSPSSGPYADELDYVAHLGPEESPLRSAIEYELGASGLSVENVLERARTQTCAGCHRRSRGADLGNGLVWPADLGFVHVSERITETVGGQVRFDISDALKDVFLPARKTILDDFLNDKPLPPPADPALPLAGHMHHG